MKLPKHRTRLLASCLIGIALVVIGCVYNRDLLRPAPWPVVYDSTFEFQLGQGSGWHGLDLIKITADGKAVYQYESSSNVWSRKTFQLTAVEMQSLADQVNELKIVALDDYYKANIHDGTQWCLLVKSQGHLKRIYCDNRFPRRIEKLAAFVHEKIIDRAGAKAVAISVPRDQVRDFEAEVWGGTN
ncbi:MAG: hypothetical protein ACHRHE_14720 [Tepidisphaerales bacterium]